MKPAFLDNHALLPFADALAAVQRTHPLVDCITNIVSVNDVANGLLAIDARPVMASAPEEIEYIVAGADAMLCNLGATASDQRDAMLKGSVYAHTLGKPVVIDPVGIGASPLRHKQMHALLQTAPVAAIRGNISEIKALAGLTTDAGGVDASTADLEDPRGFEAAVKLAQALAIRHHTVIGISGPRDIVSDGARTFIVHGGNEMMTRVTGTGCTLTGLVAAFVAAYPSDALVATTAAIALMCMAGDHALATCGTHATASFRIAMFDALSAMTPTACIENFTIQSI